MEPLYQWDCGVIGVEQRPETIRFSRIPCDPNLAKALIAFHGDDLWLTPPQTSALEQGILDADAHFLVVSPTNSGKTLIAILRIFHQALTRKARSLYVTPLKAIAEEKRKEFETTAEKVKECSGQRVRVRITTGDYQLTDDFLHSPPPRVGDVILCTPERLEIILRNPDYHPWVSQIGNVIIDEIHLLGEEKRGPTLEAAITRLRLIAPHINLLGLSATIGGIARLRDWLEGTGRSVVVLESSWRFPPLQLKVTCVQDKNAYICERLEEIIKVPESSALIFTYTKDDAKRLAQYIGTNVAPLLGPIDAVGINRTRKLQARGVGYFHSGLTLQQRNAITEAYRKNLVRVVVATTSLKMGVNLPATHVLLRDHLFWGKGHLSITDIFQMLGRAGRGNVSGHGEVLVDDASIGEMYAEKLRSMSLPPLEPRMFGASSSNGWRRGEQDRVEEEQILQVLVLTEIVACGKTSGTKIEVFLRSTFSGFVFGFHGNVQSVLQQLQQWHLIEPVEGAEDLYKPRPLGRTTCLTGLHPQTGAALGGFLVALIRLGEKEKEKDPSKDRNYLSRLTELDFLFMVCACLEMRGHLLRPPSKNRIATIQDYIEQLDPDDKPVVNLWRSESNPERSSARLLGSLKVKLDSQRPGVAEKKFYQFMDAANLLHRHSRGKTLAELADLYKVDEGKLEQGLKSTSLWLLSGLAQICDSRKCYKLDPLMLRIHELIEKVRYGSGLGSLLKLEGIGKRTIEKLLDSGFREPKDLQIVAKTDLVSIGLGQKQAEKIIKLVQKVRR